MENDKVLLVELSGIHYEVVYSHIKCLKEAGYEVLFVCYDDIKDRPEIYSAADEAVLLSEPSFRWTKPFQLLKVVRLLWEADCRNLVIATADSGIWLLRAFLLMLSVLPLDLNVVRCIHNFRPLRESFLEKKLFNNIFGKVLVLNEYIVKNNKYEINRQGLEVGHFCPCFFPKKREKNIFKDEKETWICIPGKINTERRDYYELINRIKECKIKDELRFVLLGGNEGEISEIERAIDEKGISNYFVTFESEFIPQAALNGYIKKSDFIMPLIHPTKNKYKKYIKDKISGAFNLAFGFGKPLVCAEEYKGYKDFDHFSIFYAKDEIQKIVNRLPCLKGNVIDEEYKLKEMNIKRQSRKYTSVLEA